MSREEQNKKGAPSKYSEHLSERLEGKNWPLESTPTI